MTTETTISQTATPPAATSPAPCSAPEARQFDFWLGDWDVAWGEGQRGSNHVQAILDGCVILENFDGNPAMPFRGMSVSTYDPKLGRWLQTWVDNAGNYWNFEGEFKDGQMILSTDEWRKGKKVRLRMVFYNITADELDWNWEQSEDDGVTWRLLWKIHYTRSLAKVYPAQPSQGFR